jgi:lysophospholipase L1-like esterase
MAAYYEEQDKRNQLESFLTTGTSVFTKHLFGRMKPQAAANAITFNMVIELEAEFLGFRIGIPNIHAAAVTGVKACVGVAGAVPAADFQVFTNPEASEWIDVTWNNGAASIDLPARIAEERYSLTYSDMIYLPSMPRTDSASGRPLVMVRIEYPAGSTLTTPYNDLYFWRGSSAPRIYRSTNQEVLGVTTKTSFTQNNIVTSGGDTKAVVPAIQYMTTKRGHQVMIMGDSIQEGLGGQVRDYGAIQRACYELSTPEKPVEYFNAGLHAQAPDVYSRMIEDHIDKVKPTILTYAPWSGNDVAANTGMTVAAQRRYKASLGRVYAALQQRNMKPLIFFPEATPVNTSYRNVGANDQIRRDYNAKFLPGVVNGIVMKGYAAAITGTRDAAGQDQIKVGLTGDNVHPNDSGHDALKEVVKPYIRMALDHMQ